MVNRINLILQGKNFTSKQFAEEIGIQPSAMSHILSGRNNPSLAVVMKIVTCYPEIDINWLMFGKGEMYITNRTNPGMALPNVAMPPQVPSPVSPQVSSATPLPINETFDLFSPIDNTESLASEVSKSSPIVPPSDSARTKEEPTQSTTSLEYSPKNLFIPSEETTVSVPKTTTPMPESAQPLHRENRVDDFSKPTHPNEAILSSTKKIAKIIVMYADHTFSEYFPE